MLTKIVRIMLILFSAYPFLGYAQENSDQLCHECCCSLDPTPIGVMISHTHKKNEWMFSYRYMHMNMKDMYSGTKKVSNDYVFTHYLMSSSVMQMNMHMLMAMYGLTNRLTLMGMVHYNQVSMNMEMLPGSTHVHAGSSDEGMDMTMRTAGIGDTKIQLLYGLVDRKKSQLLIAAGISLPTGNTNVKGNSSSMYNGERYPYAMQLGSGTYDFLPAINYLHQSGRLVSGLQCSSVLRMGYNTIGYRYGNEVSATAWTSFRWAYNFSSSIRMEGITTSQIKGSDPLLYSGYEPSANPANYGGQRLYGYIGTVYHLRSTFMEGSRIGVEYGIPFYQYLNGPQMGQKSSLYVSLSISL